MKTPLQELIEWLDFIIKVLPDESVGAKGQIIIAKEKAESMLEKEKEVIIDAYRNGFYDNHSLRREINSETEKYYNEAFNTKEEMKEEMKEEIEQTVIGTHYKILSRT